MKKLKLIVALCALLCVGGSNVFGQASYNKTYTEGVTVTAGGDYFLYNIGSKMFLTDGMDWGTHATADHAGRVLTLANLADGKYSINSASYSLNNGMEAKKGYMTTNGYIDSGSNDANWEFTPVSVDGYTNAYTIKNSDTQYLHFNSADCRVNVGNSTGNEYSYWLVIPKSARDAKNDLTYYLMNTDMNRPWERRVWAGSKANDNNGIAVGGLDANRCAERFHVIKDVYQTISETVPNGKYILYAQGFWRQDGSDEAPKLYANSSTADFALRTGTENDMAAVSTSFSAGNYVNQVSTIVTDGKLKVGINITSGSQWVIFDNFFLEYLGPTIINEATALPDDGTMVADKWYTVTIGATTDYNVTATTIDNIVYTTDGTILIKDVADITSKFSSTNPQEIAAGTYYVMSTSNNVLNIEAAMDTYEVGAATAKSIEDNSFISSLSTVSFTFGNASTSTSAPFEILNASAKASLKKGGVEVAQGTLTLNGKVVTATFTDITLDRNSTYTITLPAGVAGYEGQAQNDEETITFQTALIADGVYYFKKKGEYKYLTRGGNYGTETVVDNFGISLQVTVQNNGTFVLKNVDHSLADGSDKYLAEYTDAGAPKYWTIATADGGYYLKDAAGKYLTTTEYIYTFAEGRSNPYYYQTATEDEAQAIVWEILTKVDYQASLAARKDGEATAIATAAGKTATTASAFDELLASDYGVTDMTSSITNASMYDDNDGWTPVWYNAQRHYQEKIDNVNTNVDKIKRNVIPEVWNYIGGAKQDIAGLPEGIYRVTVKAVWRGGNADAANRMKEDQNVTAWMYATAGSTTNITQIHSWYDGKPGNTTAVKNSTTEYINTVYAYVAEGQTLTIGIASPSWITEPWMPFCDWTLTRYEAKATAAEKTALAEAITAAEAYTLGFEADEYAPYNNIAALTALADAKAIDTETASGKSVVAATTALTGATWTANTEEVNAIAYGDFSTYETIGGRDYAFGWKPSDADSRIMGGSEGTNNTGLSASSSGKALLLKFNATYGEKAGYTLPLKANTVYRLMFKFAGWNNQPKTDVKIALNGEAVTITPSQFWPSSNKGYEDASVWSNFDAVFKTGAAGDYVLSLNKVESGQQQIVIADVTLKKAAPESITVTEAGYATYVSDNDLDYTSVEGVTAYKATVEGSTISFNKVTTVPAGEGVLLKGEGTFSVPVTTGIEPWAADYNAFVRGNNAPVATQDGSLYNYILNDGAQGVGFYKANGQNVAKNRAYLQTTTNAARLTLTFDDETTVIEGIAETKKEDSTVTYNLKGQRVNAAQKGLYIRNGKKVVVK